MAKAATEASDPEVANKITKKILTNAKYSCFGKIKVTSKSKELKRLEVLQENKIKLTKRKENASINEGEKIDRDIASTLKQIQSNKYEKDIKKMEDLKNGKGKSATVFWLRDEVIGKKKHKMDPIALTDPKTGFKVFNPTDIKRVSLDFCMDLLKKKKPKPGYEEVFRQRSYLHNERMSEVVLTDIEDLMYDKFVEIWKS